MRRLALIIILCLFIANTFYVRSSLAVDNSDWPADSLQLKTLADAARSERVVSNTALLALGIGIALCGGSLVSNPGSGIGGVGVGSYGGLLIGTGGILSLIEMRVLFFERTDVEKKCDYMLKLNRDEQEGFAHAALLNQDPVSIELSREAYCNGVADKIVWIDAGLMKQKSIFSNRMFDVIENSFVYASPNKNNPIGHVYSKETYFVYKNEKDGHNNKWYGINIEPDHVIYNREGTK